MRLEDVTLIDKLVRVMPKKILGSIKIVAISEMDFKKLFTKDALKSN